jgi:hypothetical protein
MYSRHQNFDAILLQSACASNIYTNMEYIKIRHTLYYIIYMYECTICEGFAFSRGQKNVKGLWVVVALRCYALHLMTALASTPPFDALFFPTENNKVADHSTSLSPLFTTSTAKFGGCQ